METPTDKADVELHKFHDYACRMNVVTLAVASRLSQMVMLVERRDKKHLEDNKYYGDIYFAPRGQPFRKVTPGHQHSYGLDEYLKDRALTVFPALKELVRTVVTADNISVYEFLQKLQLSSICIEPGDTNLRVLYRVCPHSTSPKGTHYARVPLDSTLYRGDVSGIYPLISDSGKRLAFIIRFHLTTEGVTKICYASNT